MKAHKNALVSANIWQKSRLLPNVNEMMAAHKYTVDMTNIQENSPTLSGSLACRSTYNIRHKNRHWTVEPYTNSEFPASRLRNSSYARSLAGCFES